MSPRTIAVLIATLALSGCGLHDRARATSETKKPAVSVDLQATSKVVAPGIVEPLGGNIGLSPQESGRLGRLLVKEGQSVTAGELLASLDDEAERAAVLVARAEVGEATSLFERAMRGATREEIDQARADAEATKARALLTQRDAARAARLGDEKALAAAEVERAGTEADVAEATARATDAKLASVVRGARAEDRRAAEGRAAAARARLSVAEAALARRAVVAPAGGVILTSRYHPGEFFVVGKEPLFVLGDTSKLELRLEVDEIDAFRVKVGARCKVLGDDNVPIGEGTVTRLAAAMGRRALPRESPTNRADVRVREVFVEVPASAGLVPGRRVWGHVESE